MYRTVAVVAVLCVLSSVAIAASGPGSTTETGPAPRTAGGLGPEPAPVETLAFPSSLSSPSSPPTEVGGGPSAIGAPNAVLATPPMNTTAYLAIPPGNVSNATRTSAALDVGGALAVDAAATGTAIDALTLDERLSRANTTAAKRAVISRAGTRIERRIDRVLADQRATIEAYSGGRSSTREFVYALARTQTRADGLRGAIDRLETAAASVPGSAIGGESVDSWARDRRVEVGIATSPLRDRIVGALRGTGPITVYVEVSETGVVLAATDRGQYLRDAYLPAERTDGPPDGPTSTSAALGRVSDRYPWAWNHTTGVESAGGPGAGSYRVTVFHAQGGLTTYLDARTGSVFRETQGKRLGAIPTAAAVTATGDGLRVQVRRTHATGPMNVSVVDTRTTEPVNATVLVDNRTVGRTGSEGNFWTIMPRGRINVTVTDGERVVTARFTANAGSVDANETTPGGSTVISPPANRPTPTDDRSTPATNQSTPTTNRSVGVKNGTAPSTTTATITTATADGTVAEERRERVSTSNPGWPGRG